MPTLKRREWVPCPPPEGLKPEEEVFLIKSTGEIVKDYKTYLEKMTEYRSSQWSCKFTGRSGLTFDEALAEEQRSTALLSEVMLVLHVVLRVRGSSRTPSCPFGFGPMCMMHISCPLLRVHCSSQLNERSHASGPSTTASCVLMTSSQPSTSSTKPLEERRMKALLLLLRPPHMPRRRARSRRES